MINLIEATPRFWQEVLLLAKNNYGDWKSAGEARANVAQALIEVLGRWAEQQMGQEPVGQIIDKMVEDLPPLPSTS